MAKGRRLTSSRSERLLGVAAYNYGHPAQYHDESSGVSELGEDEVWSIVDDTPDHHHRWPGYGGSGEEWTTRASVESRRRQGSTITATATECRHVGGLSLAFDDKTTSSQQRIVHQFSGTVVGPSRGHMMATSAPVNVPDWSKIIRVNSDESMRVADEDDFNRVGHSVSGGAIEPPHEYLTRSRKMNAMSVFEGVGRTLKGRDMSRVRDAVWSQTGFEG